MTEARKEQPAETRVRTMRAIPYIEGMYNRARQWLAAVRKEF